MSSTCVLFMAHVINPLVRRRYRKLVAEADADVYFFYDNSRGDFNGIDGRVALFDLAQLAQTYDMRGFQSAEPAIVPGHFVFPILAFMRRHPYRFVWKIEYDVHYDESWRVLLNHFGDRDLLGTSILSRRERPDWPWWQTFRAPVEGVREIRGFFPVMRLSRRACQVLEDAYAAGWRGHDEVSVPTIVHHFGLSLEDIGGGGPFVEKENRNRFYSNEATVDGLGRGTFVYREEGLVFQPGKLHHPLKERDC